MLFQIRSVYVSIYVVKMGISNVRSGNFRLFRDMSVCVRLVHVTSGKIMLCLVRSGYIMFRLYRIRSGLVRLGQFISNYVGLLRVWSG
jgi:hypothetical protein